MWTSPPRSDAAHGRRRQAIGTALALLASVALVACTTGGPPPTATTSATAEVLPFPDGGDMEELAAGTYMVTGFSVPFEITVPDGWISFGWGVLKENDDAWQVFVNFLPPTSVPTDACSWRGTFVDTPSVQTYADAMGAQTSTQTTAPVEIVMGDYAGLEFDYTVEDGVDFAACDEDRLCLLADSGADTCTRVYGDASHRETERVLDLNGEVAMIAVGQFTEVDPALTAEARAVFDSIVFDPPAHAE